MNLEMVLEKWYNAKEKLAILEKKIEKYKQTISSEMNKKNLDKLVAGSYTISRSRASRTYVTKESMPVNLWNEYSTKCSFDTYRLAKK